jgi:hypothetical protein
MRTLPLASWLVVGAACSSSSSGPPADVAGTYTLSVTDGANGCTIPNFTTGATSTGVMVQITQSGSNVSATVMGYSGLVLAFATGNTLSGTISGNQATLTATGNHTQGNCAYTTTASSSMTFSGKQVQGSISYTDTGNGSTDCGALQQCTSTQTFTGSD